MRYLLAYIEYLPDIGARYRKWISRLRKSGYQIEAINVTLDPPGPRLSFPELERKWFHRDRKLMALYEKIADLSSRCDCLVNLTGANFHPDFVRQLSTFNVFICNDDPESSYDLSEPCAPAYDYCFTGNVACLELYHGWGIQNVGFLPLGFYEDDYDTRLTEQDILEGNRRYDVSFVGERETHWRRERLDRLKSAFPDGHFYGRGWKKGYISKKSLLLALYADTKVGPNIHNSVGPVNRRTYALPANGVMQICDNRCRLAQLFKLGKEVVGVDSIDEMVEAVRYYLAHDEKRRKIAAAGWKRAYRDYSEMAVWERLIEMIRDPIMNASKASEPVGNRHNIRSSFRERMRYDFVSLKRKTKGVIKGTAKRLGYSISREPKQKPVSVRPESPYTENPVKGPVNIELKKQLVKEGKFFEWPDIVALNYVVSSMVGPHPKRILEIGGGTGVFAKEAASDPRRHIVCCELDKGANEWAKSHRPMPNIEYLNTLLPESTEPFDLVVSIEVIEHVADYFAFLDTVARLAPRALLTTPNKLSKYKPGNRTGPPSYDYHVREWTAGEFYWILRGFYRQVSLYAMPNVYVPWCESIDVESETTPIIADCRDPIERDRLAPPVWGS